MSDTPAVPRTGGWRSACVGQYGRAVRSQQYQTGYWYLALSALGRERGSSQLLLLYLQPPLHVPATVPLAPLSTASVVPLPPLSTKPRTKPRGTTPHWY
eukprot:485387-Rhodomonas_salina.1